MPGLDMIKLKRGVAPCLATGRLTSEGVMQYRWLPSAARRKMGFRSFYLYGLPGTPLSEKDWLGLGFATPPPLDDPVTLDGPPLGLEAAVRACKLITEAAAAQCQAGTPVKTAPRPKAQAVTLNALLDRFFEDCDAGRVKKRDKDGKPVPIRAKTVDGYRKSLAPVRELAGDQPAAGFNRAELLGLCETYIEDGHHPMAVSIQRAVSRAFNHLRQSAADLRPHIPSSDVYSRLGLGTPRGRLRLALPEEAEAMFLALSEPQALANELGLTASSSGVTIPAPRPALAAAWLMGLWTIQRGIDTLNFTERSTATGRLYWIQSKTGKEIDIPLLDQALTARRLALASRAGISGHQGRLFMDTERNQPYVQRTRKTGLDHYRNANEHWRAARALAGLKVPRLVGSDIDPFGRAVPELWFSDSRDTGVTRLFASFQHQDGALASIATWHGSDIKTLLELMKHYLVLNPSFANAAGEALRDHAKAVGFEI